MKPILVNINEMSDSREIYESKPNPFLSIFIYTILGIIVISIIWMYFGKIDVVVKSDGMIRPNNQVSTVVNTYGGSLKAVYIEDGSSVKEGDTLYVIDHKDLDTELSYYRGQLTDTKNSLKMLNKYKKSVENGINYFTDNSEEEEYYIKCELYLTNYKMMQNSLNDSSKESKLDSGSITEPLEVLKRKIKYTKTLRTAVDQNKNMFLPFGDEKEYCNNFLLYQNDYNAINNKYINAKMEIDKSTTQEGLVDSFEYYSIMLKGLKTLESSIKKNKNLFDSTNSYSLKYDEYAGKIVDLMAEYKQTRENYDANKALEGLAVSESDVQQSKVIMDKAERAIDEYRASYMNNISSSITEAEKNIKDITLNKKHTISKDKLYKQNEKDRIAALSDFKLKYIVDLDNTIDALKDNITSMETNKVSYRNNELSNTIRNIKSYKDKKNELETNIDKISMQIKSTIVKATMSGFVNSNVELVKDNNLSSGTEVLSIIPKNSSKYKVNIYVSNKDIGRLKQGMKAKFNVYALPNSEYGYLTGKITYISKDLKINSNSDSAYYLVEAELNKNRLYNSKGKEVELKPGMTCQAQIITESKRILIYLLEKINLWMEK